MDINPLGDLNNYFDLGLFSVNDDFYMIMNNDPVLSSDNILQKFFGFKKELSDSSINEEILSTFDFMTWKKTDTKQNRRNMATKIEKLTIE